MTRSALNRICGATVAAAALAALAVQGGAAPGETEAERLLNERQSEFDQAIIEVAEGVYTGVGFGVSPMSHDEHSQDAALSAVNELRKEFLDGRFETLDGWFTYVGIIFAGLTFLMSAGIAVGTYILVDLKKQVTEAREHVEHIIGDAQAAVDKLETRVERNLRISGQSLDDDDPNVEEIAKRVRNNEYVAVSTDVFLDVVARSGQIDEQTIRQFVECVQKFLSQDGIIEGSSYEDRWSVSISVGEVFVFRTRNDDELRRALRGILDVSYAITKRDKRDNTSILVRGTGKFFDIKGITGLGGRAWLGFDLR